MYPATRRALESITHLPTSLRGIYLEPAELYLAVGRSAFVQERGDDSYSARPWPTARG